MRYGGAEVCYKHFLEGGGSEFGQDLIRLFRIRRLPEQHRLFEWWAGLGFIGFSLLTHGFCDTLCLADLNTAPARAGRMTVRHIRLADPVRVYGSNNLKHYSAAGALEPDRRQSAALRRRRFAGEIRPHDGGRQLHREFFRDAGRFLVPTVSVLAGKQSEIDGR